VPLPPGLRLLRRARFAHKLGLLDRLYRRALEPHAVCWVETWNGLAWKLDLANTTHRWIVYGQYEGAAFLDWAAAHLPRDGIVVDSGANIGQMLLYLAPMVPRGRVHAFEPDAAALAWLRECLAANPGLAVRCHACGLGAEAGPARLAATGPAHTHGAWNRISATEGAPVHLVRLADIAREEGIGRIDLWKLDVEGHELAALRGAEPLLRARAVGAILAELGFGRGEAVRDYLEGHGYRCHLFDGRGRLVNATSLPEHTNGLFLP